MALNQKYTWAMFLKEHPEYKEKKIKRTSPEATKAFEVAFKKHVKEYLGNRLKEIERKRDRAIKKAAALTKQRTLLAKAKKWPRAKIIQAKIGRQDAWMAQLGKQLERTKSLQKSS